MFERTLEAPEAPHIVVQECLGNLTVRGRREQQITVLVQNGADGLDLAEEDDTVSISVRDDCTLICPHGTRLTADSVLGNLRVESVHGPIDLERIRGNVDLRRVGAVVLTEALGNLSARQVAGSLEATDVKGNARVAKVEQRLQLAQVAGNLKAEGLEAGLEAEKVRGNVALGPPFSPDTTYRLNSGGNLTVSVPADASLRLAVRARGRVHSGILDLELERDSGEVKGTLGGGEALLEADVRGNLSLRRAGAVEAFEGGIGLDEIGAQIEWQVNEALAEMATRLETSLGRVDAESVKRQVERTTEQARRKAEHAAEQARMRAERAERRWERASGRKAAEKTATHEETMRVLRMVEEGKLTPEQASEILAALDG